MTDSFTTNNSNSSSDRSSSRMPYITSDGSIASKRTIYRLSIFSDIFWGIIDFFYIFITTLVDPKKPIKRRYDPSKEKPYGTIGSGRGGGDDSGGIGPPRRRQTDVSAMRAEADACKGGS